MQLSTQVSVAELANNCNGKISVVMPSYHECFLKSSRLLLLIQSTVCSQDPEPRVLDGWQGSKRVPPSMQYDFSCKTTQQLKSKNRQATGWKTSRPIPRHAIFLSSGVSEAESLDWGHALPLPFPFWSFPLPLFWV